MKEQEVGGQIAPVNVWQTLSQAEKDKATEALIQIAEELIEANHDVICMPSEDRSIKSKENKY